LLDDRRQLLCPGAKVIDKTTAYRPSGGRLQQPWAVATRKEALMTTDAKTDLLVTAIEHRLTDISEQQHALAVEKARLLEQLTPLRLGILAPDMAVAQLKAKGVKLRRLSPATSADRRPRPATLKAVASIRPALVPLALAGPQSPGKTKAAL
jgi:hypothetical protein